MTTDILFNLFLKINHLKIFFIVFIHTCKGVLEFRDNEYGQFGDI